MGKFSCVLLASDLDGTLYNRQKQVSAESRAAIEYFMAEGGTFTVCTGRALQAFASPRREIPLNAPVILANGALIFDYETETVLHDAPLSGDYRAVCRAALSAFPEAAIEAHLLEGIFVMGSNLYSEYHLRTVKATGTLVEDLDAVPTPWLKALFVADAPVLRTISEWFLPRFGGQYDLFFSHPSLLEMQSPLANKGEGVRVLAERLGIAPQHVYCAGDQENDRPMLRAFYAFAPQNAEPEILSLADEVVADCDHHTIAEVIARLDGRY